MGALERGRPGLRAENWELREFGTLQLGPPHPHSCPQKGHEQPSDSLEMLRGSHWRVTPCAGEAEGAAVPPESLQGARQPPTRERVAGGQQWKPPGRRDTAPLQHLEMGLTGGATRHWDRSDTRRKRNQASEQRVDASPWETHTPPHTQTPGPAMGSGEGTGGAQTVR